jgi:hypothetical protein
MFAALVELQAEQAEKALCRAIDALLPNAEAVQLSPIEQSLVEDAREAAGDKSPAEILAEKLSAYLLPPAREQAARQRLGQAGQLPLNLYEIQSYGNSWKAGIFHGVTQAEVRSALDNAEIVEHMSTSLERAPADVRQAGATIVATRVKTHGGSHWLLITMGRDGAMFFDVKAWRLANDLVSPGRITAQSLLEGLLRKCGRKFAPTPGATRQILAWNALIPGRTLAPQVEGDNQWEGSFFFIANPGWNRVEMILGYAVDGPRYDQYVRTLR